jgi:hypothetical protein
VDVRIINRESGEVVETMEGMSHRSVFSPSSYFNLNFNWESFNVEVKVNDEWESFADAEVTSENERG